MNQTENRYGDANASIFTFEDNIKAQGIKVLNILTVLAGAREGVAVR